MFSVIACDEKLSTDFDLYIDLLHCFMCMVLGVKKHVGCNPDCVYLKS